jgi:glycerate kinase
VKNSGEFLMKIVLAPDSYKGSLTAQEICHAMANGVKKVLPQADIVNVPMADGGEGTVRSLIDATGGRIVHKTVTGPIGEHVDSFFGIMGDGKTAVIEMAAASGLPLIPKNKQDPRITTTYGTGELMMAALDEHCTKILIGIGGSATNDGGAGMAQALGYRFLDSQGCELPPGGLALKNLTRIDKSKLDPRLTRVEIVTACDVTNPLTGPEGASAIYGPQKGATPAMVKELDQALQNYANVIKKDFGIDIANCPGAGAAGGLGAGLMVLAGAHLQRGIEIVIEAIGLKQKLKGADLVITGEGRIDGQTINGKTPIGVAQAAKTFNLPVLAVAGGLGPGAELVFQHGIDGIFSIIDRPMTLEEAIEGAANLVTNATERVLRIYIAGSNG